MLKVDIENFDKNSLKTIDATNKKKNINNNPQNTMQNQILDVISQRRPFIGKLSLKIF